MNDITTIGLASVEAPVDPELIATLEGLVERARKGEVLSIALCGEMTGREIFTALAGNIDVPRTIGTLEILKLRLALAAESAGDEDD